MPEKRRVVLMAGDGERASSTAQSSSALHGASPLTVCLGPLLGNRSTVLAPD